MGTVATPDVSQNLLLEMIDSEIEAGLMFISVAGSAYRAHKFSTGSFVLSKAETIHQHVSTLAESLIPQENPEIERKISDLRGAIDRLRSGGVS